MLSARFNTEDGPRNHFLGTTNQPSMSSAPSHLVPAPTQSSQYIGSMVNDPWRRSNVDANGEESQVAGVSSNQLATAAAAAQVPLPSSDLFTSDAGIHKEVLAQAISFFGEEKLALAHAFAQAFGSRSVLDETKPLALEQFHSLERYVSKGNLRLSSTMARLLVRFIEGFRDIRGVRKSRHGFDDFVLVTTHARDMISSRISELLAANGESFATIHQFQAPSASTNLAPSTKSIGKRKMVDDDSANASQAKRSKSMFGFFHALSLCELPEIFLFHHPMLREATYFFQDEAFAKAFLKLHWQERSYKQLPIQGGAIYRAQGIPSNFILVSRYMFESIGFVFNDMRNVPGSAQVQSFRWDRISALMMPLEIRDQIRTRISALIEARQKARDEFWSVDPMRARLIEENYERQFAAQAHIMAHIQYQDAGSSTGPNNHLDPSQYALSASDAIGQASAFEATESDLQRSDIHPAAYEQMGIEQTTGAPCKEIDGVEFEAGFPKQFGTNFDHNFNVDPTLLLGGHHPQEVGRTVDAQPFQFDITALFEHDPYAVSHLESTEPNCFPGYKGDLINGTTSETSRDESHPANADLDLRASLSLVVDERYSRAQMNELAFYC